MMRRMGAAMVMAVLTVIPAVALGQAFESCPDARNYGKNLSEVTVGQVMARVQCDASLLPEAEAALVDAMKALVPTWTGPPRYKVCYFEGLYESAIQRLERDYARCPSDPAFRAPTVETVSSIAMATFAAMLSTEPNINTERNVRDIFDIDYGFLGPGTPRNCTARVEAMELEVLGEDASRHTRLLNVIEAEICRAQ